MEKVCMFRIDLLLCGMFLAFIFIIFLIKCITVECLKAETLYLNILSKEILEKVLDKHRQGIVVKQVAAGREFQGCPFYSKPDVIHFKVCKVFSLKSSKAFSLI